MKPDILSSEELEKILLGYGLVTQDQLDMAHERADLDNITLREAIVWHNFLTDEELGKLMAEYFKVSYVNLQNKEIEEAVLQILPEVVARKNVSVTFSLEKDQLSLATADPTNLEFFNFIERKQGLKVKVFYATEKDITRSFGLYHKSVTVAFDSILQEGIAGSQKSGTGDPPIVRIVDTLFQYAFQNKASDIHLEPQSNEALVRFRIDGMLHDIAKIPLHLHPQIVSRIKVLAQLRTDEHHVPQDGKLQINIEKATIDVRVSIIPITNGEKIVLRLLSDNSRQFSLTNLGVEPSLLQVIEAEYHKPFGMVLVTGPTGCGKTTTLYSFLKLLNRRTVNIMTIEDPVEYDIEGVNQIQVNPDARLTFATGLRSILRQDPNIILVGEIRDSETASIATNLAMTGHLVLSSLHTNNAVTTVPRLLDLGIEPFLVASTINVIVAQRLVRKIHEACRVSQEVPLKELIDQAGEESVRAIYGNGSPEETFRIYFGKGCSLCQGTGFQGRTGIFEVLIFDEALRHAIIHRKSTQELEQLARANGMKTIFEDGIQKVKNGITTLEEIIRVSQE